MRPREQTTDSTLAAYAEQVAAAAPPLSAESRDRLSLLLRPSGDERHG
jgi:hypothetical protein